MHKTLLLTFSADDTSSLSEHDDFAYATLQAVNRARFQYRARPVELDTQLSIIAQRWATQMARTGKLEHSPVELRHYGRQTLGENFIGFAKSEITGKENEHEPLVISLYFDILHFQENV